MALVTRLNHQPLDREVPHTEVDATYSFGRDSRNRQFLQVDTYGSKERQRVGKKSQSIRFGPEGIRELKRILATLPD